MKALRWIIAIALLALPLSAAAEAPQTPPSLVVTGKVIEKTVAQTMDVVGTLQFDRLSEISPEVSGQVEKVLIVEGDRLEKGAPLFHLGLDFVENEINTVKKRIAQLDIRLAKAQKDLKRYETLYRQQATSEQEYDNIRLTMEDLAVQKAVLEENLNLALLKKKKSTIKAPFKGLILEKNVDKGNWVAPGSKLCMLGSLSDLFIKVPMPEVLLPYATKGEEVHVSMGAVKKELKGTIDGFIPVADPTTKNVFVKVKLPALESAVLNMSATVSMPSSEKKKMTLIPRDAMVTFAGNTLVYTIKDGAAQPLPVSVITYVDGLAAIAPGPVAPGMEVVIDGNDRLQPGTPVQVIEKR